MKATKTTLVAALAVGSLLMLNPALRADDTTNTPPAGGPPPGRMHMHGPGMSGHMNFDQLAKHLKLTDTQKSKVQAIFESKHQRMRELWQDQSLSREDRRAKMKAIHEDILGKLKTVLTVDQFKQFQEMRRRMGGLRHGQPGGPSPDNGGTNAPAATSPQS